MVRSLMCVGKIRIHHTFKSNLLPATPLATIQEILGCLAASLGVCMVDHVEVKK